MTWHDGLYGGGIAGRRQRRFEADRFGAVITASGVLSSAGATRGVHQRLLDILHSGHITYLSEAKALGDILIVGLNSDDSVRRLKGPTRPVNPLADRAQVLSALSCVDHIVSFDEDTPEEIIRALRPHIFVKGGDYTRARLPEAALVESLGGEVRILPYVRERSTTRIIERIRAQTAYTRAA